MRFETRGHVSAPSFEALSRHAFTINGQSTTLDPEAVLQQPVYFVIAPDGTLPQMWFPPETSELARQLVGGTIERLDFRAAPGGTTRVRAGHGLADARYTQEGDGKLHRSIERLVRFDGVPGIEADALSVEGEAVVELDADRVPLSFVVKESVAFIRDGRAFDSNESFSLVLERAREETPSPVPTDLHAWASRDPSDPPDRSESERAFAQQMAQDMTLGELHGAVVAMEAGRVPHRGFISKAAGMLRGWPETADALVAVGQRTRTSAARQLVFDLLVAGGTPEAQAVMRELTDHALAEAWEDLPILVNRFGFLPQPEPVTVAFVLELEGRARGGGREDVANATLYTLGALSRTLEQVEPWSAAMLHARLLEAFEQAADSDRLAAAIAGLGNTGRSGDCDLLLPLVHDEDDRIRAFAVSGLRQMVMPEVTAVLVQSLADSDPFVATEALEALDGYHFGPEQSGVLASVTLHQQHNPDIEGRIVNALVQRIDDDPLVVVALRAVADRTHDVRLRSRIEGHLVF